VSRVRERGKSSFHLPFLHKNARVCEVHYQRACSTLSRVKIGSFTDGIKSLSLYQVTGKGLRGVKSDRESAVGCTFKVQWGAHSAKWYRCS
jgi:hypothetical protein